MCVCLVVFVGFGRNNEGCGMVWVRGDERSHVGSGDNTRHVVMARTEGAAEGDDDGRWWRGREDQGGGTVATGSGGGGGSPGAPMKLKMEEKIVRIEVNFY